MGTVFGGSVMIGQTNSNRASKNFPEIQIGHIENFSENLYHGTYTYDSMMCTRRMADFLEVTEGAKYQVYTQVSGTSVSFCTVIINFYDSDETQIGSQTTKNENAATSGGVSFSIPEGCRFIKVTWSFNGPNKTFKIAGVYKSIDCLLHPCFMLDMPPQRISRVTYGLPELPEEENGRLVFLNFGRKLFDLQIGEKEYVTIRCSPGYFCSGGWHEIPTAFCDGIGWDKLPSNN